MKSIVELKSENHQSLEKDGLKAAVIGMVNTFQVARTMIKMSHIVFLESFSLNKHRGGSSFRKLTLFKIISSQRCLCSESRPDLLLLGHLMHLLITLHTILSTRFLRVCIELRARQISIPLFTVKVPHGH